jgi:uncharacterized phage infection (PIP) family protein YhgE
MADLDAGVENLQRFCGLLRQTNARLQEGNRALESAESALSDLESDAEEKLEAASDALDEFTEDLDEGRDDAAEAARDLAAAGEDADSRLETVRGDLDELLADTEQAIAAERARLDESFSELSDDGFKALSTTLDGVETAVADMSSEADKSFADFKSGVEKTSEGVNKDLGDKTREGFGEVAIALRNDVEEKLEAEGQAQVAALDKATEAVTGSCDGVAAPLEALYADFGSESLAQGDSLIQRVTDTLKEASDFCTDEVATPVGDGVGEVVDTSLPALGAKLDDLQAVLATGEAVVEPLPAMVDDLVIVERVIQQVDELLNAVQ